MSEDEVLLFLRTHISSVYTLEVLLLLKQRGTVWRFDELVRELRSSQVAISTAVDRLVSAGLVVEQPVRCFSFAPAAAERASMAEAIEKLYAAKPMTVVKTIMEQPDSKLREFSDAFKLKK